MKLFKKKSSGNLGFPHRWSSIKLVPFPLIKTFAEPQQCYYIITFLSLPFNPLCTFSYLLVVFMQYFCT